MEVLERMKAGEWVMGFVPELYPVMLKCEKLCFQLNNIPPDHACERAEIIKQIFGHIGRPFTIHSPFRCDFGSHISIGHHFFANYNLTILDEGDVTIGNHVFFGPNCSIYTIIHALEPEKRNAGVMRAKPVTIGNNVWICGDVTILPGVTIGDGAVIGAGSVVTGDIPPMTLAMGNPCKPVREIIE